jgi:hypothetical protein
VPLVGPHWAQRYGRRIEIGKVPGGKSAIIELAESIGADGKSVLTAVWAGDAPAHLRALPQVWVHHYYFEGDGRLRWREGSALPPASLRFDSPYDTDAHWCIKRDTAWSGYRVHLTETCDEDLPHLVVHVATTIARSKMASSPGRSTTSRPPVGWSRRACGRCPLHAHAHPHRPASTPDHPARPDRPQSQRADKSAFTIGGEHQIATCPRGSPSR